MSYGLETPVSGYSDMDGLAAELEQGGPYPDEGHRKIKPLNRQEVRATVQSELNDALGGYDSQIEEQRRKALSFYNGRPFGNEQEGRSQVVLTDVADTIEWVMPQLMRMFTGGPHAAEYLPRPMSHPTEEQLVQLEEQAKQATDYVNLVFWNRCEGFEALYHWFKTALLEKNGVVKIWTETRYEPKSETYAGLSDVELGMLLEDGNLRVVAHEAKQVGTDETGQPILVYDVDVVRVHERRELRVKPVPPEEFLIARRVIRLDDETPFCAHRIKVTVSDLIAMGYPPELVENVPSDDSPEFTLGRTERFSEDETFPETYRHGRSDEASREIWLTECYIRIDEDGDGYAELRKITVAGESSVVILDDEPVNHVPFASITPVPMPHKFFGLSLADLVMDLQLIRSTLLRSMLDNLYLTNNSRTVIVEDMVEIDDLLVSRPGGLIRAESVDAVKPLETAPFPAMAYNMLEFLEEVRQNRTGITRYTQGMDATSLNHTATGVERIMEAAQMRIESIARVFANTGVKRMFRLLYRELIEGGHSQDVVRMRGHWMPVNPSSWNEDIDVMVRVGLGIGQAQQRAASLSLILELQEKMAANGLGGMMFKPRHLFRIASELTHLAGYENAEMFFVDPGEADFPQPQPSPDQIKAQTEAATKPIEAEAKKRDTEIQAVMQAALAEDRAKGREIELAQIKSREAIAMAELAVKERIEVAKIDAQKHEGREAA